MPLLVVSINITENLLIICKANIKIENISGTAIYLGHKATFLEKKNPQANTPINEKVHCLILFLEFKLASI